MGWDISTADCTNKRRPERGWQDGWEKRQRRAHSAHPGKGDNGCEFSPLPIASHAAQCPSGKDMPPAPPPPPPSSSSPWTVGSPLIRFRGLGRLPPPFLKVSRTARRRMGWDWTVTCGLDCMGILGTCQRTPTWRFDCCAVRTQAPLLQVGTMVSSEVMRAPYLKYLSYPSLRVL